MKRTLRHLPAVVMTALTAMACASAPGGAPRGSDEPPIVQPGAPGEASRTYDAGPIDEIQGAAHTEADVRFMQGMIHHHAQALEMTALVPERTTSRGFHRMALRMEISQSDEIGIMRTWLEDRGEAVPHVGDHPGMRGGGTPAGMRSGGMQAGTRGETGHMMMPGMLSPEQMQQLRDATGPEFERLFLELMIQHHEGAIVMVRDLFDTPGAAQESTVNFFANEVDADQTIEIQRMRRMLEERQRMFDERQRMLDETALHSRGP